MSSMTAPNHTRDKGKHKQRLHAQRAHSLKEPTQQANKDQILARQNKQHMPPSTRAPGGLQFNSPNPQNKTRFTRINTHNRLTASGTRDSVDSSRPKHILIDKQTSSRERTLSTVTPLTRIAHEGPNAARPTCFPRLPPSDPERDAFVSPPPDESTNCTARYSSSQGSRSVESLPAGTQKIPSLSRHHKSTGNRTRSKSRASPRAAGRCRGRAAVSRASGCAENNSPRASNPTRYE